MISPVMLICFVLLIILVWLAVLMNKIYSLKNVLEDKIAELEVIIEEHISQDLREIPP